MARKVLITMGVVPLIMAVLFAFIPPVNQPVAAANAALGSTLTPTLAPTGTPIPPTDTPIPPTNTPIPTNTPVPLPTQKSSKPAPTAIPTPTPALILPVSGGGGSQVWVPWALGVTALLCGVLLRGWNRLRGAREI